jgi:hypothetical protein
MNFLSHSGGMRGEPKTPKRSVLSPSPVKLSPAMLHSLRTLPSTLSAPPAAATAMPSSSSKGSFSMSRWLGKPSPRKLVVTPKKSAGVTSMPNSEGQLKMVRPGVKRKLCASDDSSDMFGTTLKVSRLGSENDPKLSPIAVRLESGLKPERILSAVQINFDSRSEDCRPNVDDEVVGDISSSSVKKDIPSPSVFRSPTVDLPNYVLDPQPRTPIGRWTSPRKQRTPDWLTQLRLNKQQTTSPTQISESPGGRSSSRNVAGRQSGSPSTRYSGHSSPATEVCELCWP